MQPKTVTVGRTVVGAFTTTKGMVRCINMLAPGCNPKIKTGYRPEIKTGYRPEVPVARKQRISNNAPPGFDVRIVYLKPGDFRL